MIARAVRAGCHGRDGLVRPAKRGPMPLGGAAHLRADPGAGAEPGARVAVSRVAMVHPWGAPMARVPDQIAIPVSVRTMEMDRAVMIAVRRVAQGRGSAEPQIGAVHAAVAASLNASGASAANGPATSLNGRAGPRAEAGRKVGPAPSAEVPRMDAASLGAAPNRTVAAGRAHPKGVKDAVDRGNAASSLVQANPPAMASQPGAEAGAAVPINAVDRIGRAAPVAVGRNRADDASADARQVRFPRGPRVPGP